MKITCISDLHGVKPVLLGGDLLIISGDLTDGDGEGENFDFIEWLRVQPYQFKVVVAGNHDGYIQNDPDWFRSHIESSIGSYYLQDSFCLIEGHKIYGMPWTPPFMNWNFMADPWLMKEKVSKIPHDTDILVTHGPAKGILDICEGRRLGCQLLMERIWELDDLKLHTFGHIHSGYGQKRFKSCDVCDLNGRNWDFLSINCSLMSDDYHPDNDPIQVEL